MTKGRKKQREEEKRRAAEASEEYLLRLRQRVRWQAEAAERHRRLRPVEGGLDEDERDPTRVEEWRKALAALGQAEADELRRLQES